jgi:hypothetical protein
MHTCIHTHIHTEKLEIDKQTDREKERMTDRQKETDTARQQADRYREA